MKKRNRDSLNLDELSKNLAIANVEEEVRLGICAALNISNNLRVIGSTDGVWESRLFEFKWDKKFSKAGQWRKSAYGALAQALYYCRRILNFEVEGLSEVPHTIVICDKNGGFILETRQFEGLLHFDPEIFASRRDVVDSLKSYFGRDWLKTLNENLFSWDSPPSQQDEGLVHMLEGRKALSQAQYYDFTDVEQLHAFLKAVSESNAVPPIITITKQNFVGIFGRWFHIFAPQGASKREWADRFVIDLRTQYKLDEKTGELKYHGDSWTAPVDVYKEFWKLYKRPPEDIVDQFIATNKDVLYSQEDQNNFGDFYTPLKLVGLAQRCLSRHLDKAPKNRLWWDPAAGGGNLFFRFSAADNVILSTKFKADCDGLRSNPAVKGATILQLDFISDIVESDLLLRKTWESLQKKFKSADEIVLFMNPPFDDQAESRGTNQSIPDGFIHNEDISRVTPRTLRSMNTRFFYRILSLARAMNKPVKVASFSSAAWVVGPDSRQFCQVWAENFNFLDGFLVSSKVFNGIKSEWPVLFSVWEYAPNRKNAGLDMTLDVFDRAYKWLGKKTLRPFSEGSVRLSEIAKLDKDILGKRSDYVLAPPLKNEFEIAETIYEDVLPKDALGYFRFVANDVYNSAMRVQFVSGMFGPSNHNGVPVMKENFEKCLSVYGVRKAVRIDWLNNKDEFYLPKELGTAHIALLRKAAVFALVDGGYASSLSGLKYKGKTLEIRNAFSIISRLELRNWGASDIPEHEPMAAQWVGKNKVSFTELEKSAIKAAKDLIKSTFSAGVRAKGDPKRQLWRGDAGMRQLINGLLDFDGISLPDEISKLYKDYQTKKERLREQVEKEIYRLSILMPFSAHEDDDSKSESSERSS